MRKVLFDSTRAAARPAAAFAAAALLAAARILVPAPADAAIEDFETWDLGAQEGDDEYGIDSYFLSFSPEWETEWLFEREGARSSMGSTVNEVWEMRNEIRLNRELDPRLRFTYRYLQNEGLVIDHEEHSIGLEIERGGLWFGPFARPNSDKQKLDAGLFVRKEWGRGTEVQLTLSFEDWNSDHTNGRSTIQDRTAVDFIDPAREWSVRARRLWNSSRWLALDAQWLPEFRRGMVPSPFSNEPSFSRHTGGSHVLLRAMVDPAGDLSVEWRAEYKESRVADFPATGAAVDMRRDARLLRTRVTHPVTHGFLGRIGLQFRDGEEKDVIPGPDPYRLAFSDVVATAGVRREVLPWLNGEFGYGHQQTDITQEGPEDTQRFTWGTRTENRLYLIAEFVAKGFRARFTETIELDDEGYSAVSDHDKGSIQLQAVF